MLRKLIYCAYYYEYYIFLKVWFPYDLKLIYDLKCASGFCRLLYFLITLVIKGL